MWINERAAMHVLIRKQQRQRDSAQVVPKHHAPRMREEHKHMRTSQVCNAQRQRQLKRGFVCELVSRAMPPRYDILNLVLNIRTTTKSIMRHAGAHLPERTTPLPW